MKKLFIIVNLDTFFLSHRKEIALRARQKGFDVTIVAKDTGKGDEIKGLGLNFINLPINKAGLNLSPFELYTEVNNELADIVPHGQNDFDFGRDFKREIKNFIDAVNGRAECLATAEDGVELMRILDAIYLSAETGKSVDIVR